jgi:hypothetical protein
LLHERCTKYRLWVHLKCWCQSSLGASDNFLTLYWLSLPVAKSVQCFFCTVCLLEMYLNQLVTWKMHQIQTLSAPKVLMSIIFRSKWQCVSLPVASVQCFFCFVCLLDMYMDKLITWKMHQTQTLSAPKVLMSIVSRSKWQFLDFVLCVSASNKCAMLRLHCVSAWNVLESACYMKDAPNTHFECT